MSIDAKENYVESAQIFDNQLVQQLKKKEPLNKNVEFYSPCSRDVPESLRTISGPFYIEKHIDFNDKHAFLQLLSSYHTGIAKLMSACAVKQKFGDP